MEHIIEKGSDGLVMDEKDQVATVLREMTIGETMRCYRGTSMVTIQLQEGIPFGHKVALVRIEKGSAVYKYGDVIGKAIQDIEPGQHVHVHNIEGIRGRGDLKDNRGTG